MNTFVSDLSKKEFPLSERVPCKFVRPSLLALIRQDHPDFGDDQVLSLKELNDYREKYISGYLVKEMGEITTLEETVLQSLNNHTSLVNAVEEDTETRSVGQKVADKVADFGGSWTFILSFTGFIFVWIAVNAFWLSNKGFDPYPFILLNLLLSCLAALQAPVIMMSQNRQEEKDRKRNESDYIINLKAEVEIRTLHQKMDLLLQEQFKKLMEIQIEQIKLLQDIIKKDGEKKA